MALFQLTLLAEEEDRDLLTGLLALDWPEGWQEESLNTGETRFLVNAQDRSRLLTLQEALLLRLPGLTSKLEEKEDKDWLAAWRASCTPIRCGRRFVVVPPWEADTWEKKARDEGRIAIVIEPKNAFGTGQHETTALCLSLLGDYEARLTRSASPLRFLDLGTGSGILAIAAAKMGCIGLGLDIDPDAIKNAEENARTNGCSLHFATGSLDLVKTERFQLILANILAGPLIELAPRLAQSLADDGLLILSGILTIQEENVAKAFKEAALTKVREEKMGEWCALVFTR